MKPRCVEGWVRMLQFAGGIALLGCSGDSTSSQGSNASRVAANSDEPTGANRSGPDGGDPAGGETEPGGSDPPSDGSSGEPGSATDAPSSPACSTADVGALLASGCGGMGCHEGEAPAASLDLLQADWDAAVVETPSASCEDWQLVVPGSAERSFFYQKLAAEKPECGLPMPVGKRWSDADIACVQSWIVALGGEDPPPPCENCNTTLCIDLQNDAKHCGACDNACGSNQTCSGGECQGCAEGLVSCDGECVDLQSNALHCGECGKQCGGGQTCVEGACQCAPGADFSFARDVQPLFDATCAGNACHTGRRPAAGLDLSRGRAYQALVGPTSTQCQGQLLVAPADPQESYLMDKLLGVDMCMGTAMPKGSKKLSQEQLDTVGAWICSGAKP